MRAVTDCEVVATGLQFPEGPVAMRDGSVLFVEIRRGTLSRWREGEGVTVVAEVGDGPNGAAIGPDGAVWLCNNGGFPWTLVPGTDFWIAIDLATGSMTPPGYRGGRLEKVDLATGAVTVVHDRIGEHRLRGPNDLVFDRTGGCWFTDLGKRRERDEDCGALYYSSTDGTLSEVVYGMHGPNGVGLSPDEDRVYVSETATGRLWAFPLSAPGTLAAGGGHNPLAGNGGSVLMRLEGNHMFDSLAVDTAGRVCAAVPTANAIAVVEPDGRSELVEIPRGTLHTNLCFAGADLRTVFLTASGSGELVRCRWPDAGKPLAFAR